jgi:hypothetical protein
MKYSKENLQAILNDGAASQKILTGPAEAMRCLSFALRRERKRRAYSCSISFKEDGQLGHIILNPRVEVL